MVARSLSCAALCFAALVGCSRTSERRDGQLVIAVTVDWEGAYFSGAGLDALDALRGQLPGAPLTHFVSAAYFSKREPDPQTTAHLASAIREEDELAVHLHAWRSLAEQAGIEPRLSPSFLTGTASLLEGFPGGDVGFDVDLDVYSVAELRALVRTSRELLQRTNIPISTSFRAGGYLATPKVLQAIRDEGFLVDSSATTPTQFSGAKDRVLRERIEEVWPAITPASQPFSIDTPSGPLTEMPIAVVADYSAPNEIGRVMDAARAQLAAAPAQDVMVIIALHQETADEFAPRVAEAVAHAAATGGVQFTTVAAAAQRLTSSGKLLRRAR